MELPNFVQLDYFSFFFYVKQDIFFNSWLDIIMLKQNLLLKLNWEESLESLSNVTYKTFYKCSLCSEYYSKLFCMLIYWLLHSYKHCRKRSFSQMLRYSQNHWLQIKTCGTKTKIQWWPLKTKISFETPISSPLSLCTSFFVSMVNLQWIISLLLTIYAHFLILPVWYLLRK